MQKVNTVVAQPYENVLPSRVHTTLDLDGIEHHYDGDRNSLSLVLSSQPLPEQILSTQLEALAESLGLSETDFNIISNKCVKVITTELIINVLRKRIK